MQKRMKDLGGGDEDQPSTIIHCSLSDIALICLIADHYHREIRALFGVREKREQEG